MISVKALPSELRNRNPDTWTPEEWAVFSGMFWKEDGAIGKDEMKVGTWWHVRPGGGELYLAETKSVTDGFALLYGAGRLFLLSFNANSWR